MEEAFKSITIADCDINLIQCLLDSDDPAHFVETHRMELALLLGQLLLVKYNTHVKPALVDPELAERTA